MALTNQDTGIHAPPTTGSAATFDYNLFTPAAGNFPAVGGTYTDPVFGAVVRRLTNIGEAQNQDDVYAHHYANADGTLAFNRLASGLRIINTVTGAVVHSGQPLGDIGYEIAWDALDPDKYYFLSGASLMRRNLAAQTNTTIKTFPGTLESVGGSLNYQTANGRYFVVMWGGTAKVWDSQTDTIYGGAIPPSAPTGWVTITPDGKYLVTAGGGTGGRDHLSYSIDHVAHSVSATGVLFWDLCGDHGVVISASDGKNYFVTHACYNSPGIYRVDMSLNQQGRSEAQQLADAQLLIPTGWGINDGHMSAVSKGANANWVFIDTENFSGAFETPYDDFNSATTGWVPYKQEIIAVNVITLAVRRLAHHRSRGLAASYYNQPRVSCAWDGSMVMWTSNFNDASPAGDADLYMIASPLVDGGNSAPIVANAIPNQTGTASAPINFQFASNTFADPNGDTLTYTAPTKPAWLTFTAATRTFTGTLVEGSHTVVVRATDTGGLWVEDTFTITVAAANAAPSFTSTPVTAATEDSAYSYSVTCSDADAGNTLTITAPTKPAWLTLTDHGNRTATLSGTPTNANVGAHSVVLQVSDGSASVQQSFTVTVSNTNDAPIVSAPIPDQSATVGQAFSYQFPANTFTDPDAGATLTYTAPGLPAWLTFTAGTRTIAGMPSAAGQSVVTIRASDGVAYVEDQFTITTAAAANHNPTVQAKGPYSVTKNQVATITGATLLSGAADVDGDNLTLQSVQGATHGTVSLVGGNAVFTPETDYVGSAGFTYTVSDGLGGVATGNVALNISAAPTGKYYLKRKVGGALVGRFRLAKKVNGALVHGFHFGRKVGGVIDK